MNEILLERANELIREDPTYTLICSDCMKPIYRVKRDVIAKLELEAKDLEKLHDWKTREGEVQLDCPFCFGDVFEKNFGGGFRCYPEELMNKHEKRIGRNKRYPHDSGIRPGIRVRKCYYADPYGAMLPARQAMLG